MITPPRRVAPGEHLTAAHYNALLDFVRRSTPIAGSNISIDYSMGGSRISGTPAGTPGNSVRTPFDIRYHDVGDGGEPQWEIFLPLGCLSVGRDCTPINKPAKDTSGHEDDGDGWYVLKLEGDVEGSDGAVYRVVVHGKPHACRSGIDELDGPIGAVMFVDAKAEINPDDEEEGDESSLETHDRNREGDTFSQTVATIEKSGTEDVGTVRKIVSSPISVSADSVRNFEPVWWFSVDSDCSLQLDRILVVRNNESVAGATIDGPTSVDVTGASEVYCHIHTDSYGTHTVEIVSDPDGMETNGTNTWIRLFSLRNNCLVADYRLTNLSNVQLYR